MSADLLPENVLRDSVRWLERAVIGLNLCPFARAVAASGRIRWVISDASNEAALAADLARELKLLQASDPGLTETTILVHPQVLCDFDDYNQFLDVADALLTELDLSGELQIASFHPDYRFAGTDESDVTNYSNRSPYPTLHLLRESSIARAISSIPDAQRIYENNIETLRRLGVDGRRRLWLGSMQ